MCKLTIANNAKSFKIEPRKKKEAILETIGLEGGVHMTYHYLIDLALILLSTKLLGLITQKFQMPQVVGALLAGLILGPSCLNVLSETEFLSQLSELGVIVLMFSAGMGTDIQELKHSGKAGFLMGAAGRGGAPGNGHGFGLGRRSVGSHRKQRLPGECVPGHDPDGHLREHLGGDPQGNGKAGTRVGNTILARH